MKGSRMSSDRLSPLRSHGGPLINTEVSLGMRERGEGAHCLFCVCSARHLSSSRRKDCVHPCFASSFNIYISFRPIFSSSRCRDDAPLCVLFLTPQHKGSILVVGLRSGPHPTVISFIDSSDHCFLLFVLQNDGK